MTRPDALAGLSANQRLRREAKDAAYLARANIQRLVDPASLKRNHTTWSEISHGTFGPHNLKPFQGNEPVDLLQLQPSRTAQHPQRRSTTLRLLRGATDARGKENK